MLVNYILPFLQVIVTERAGHARDVVSSITNGDLNLYDGVVAVVRIYIPLLVHFPISIFLEHTLFFYTRKH